MWYWRGNRKYPNCGQPAGGQFSPENPEALIRKHEDLTGPAASTTTHTAAPQGQYNPQRPLTSRKLTTNDRSPTGSHGVHRRKRLPDLRDVGAGTFETPSSVQGRHGSTSDRRFRIHSSPSARHTAPSLGAGSSRLHRTTPSWSDGSEEAYTQECNDRF